MSVVGISLLPAVFLLLSPLSSLLILQVLNSSTVSFRVRGNTYKINIIIYHFYLFIFTNSQIHKFTALVSSLFFFFWGDLASLLSAFEEFFFLIEMLMLLLPDRRSI